MLIISNLDDTDLNLSPEPLTMFAWIGYGAIQQTQLFPS